MSRPLLVYVHVPFCMSKCHFCDWVTEIPTSDLLRRAKDPDRVSYVDALCRQIRQRGAELRDQGYQPVIHYWGGGTASILTVEEIHRIGAALHEVLDLTDLRESTIECSPETLTAEKLAAFRDIGFFRMSSGVQSFHDPRLRALGRAHTAESARRAFHLAAEAGFTDLNIDLMCGFPGEDLGEVEHSVTAALSLPVTHVALYPFRPAVGTVLRRQMARGDSQILRAEQKQAYRLGRGLLTGAGFPEYAMSHFGRLRCHSDLAYFRLEMDWVGFGSEAGSLLDGTFSTAPRGRLAAYNRDPFAVAERHPVASDAVAPRLMYQSLTTFEGALADNWLERGGVPLEKVLELPAVRHLTSFLDGVAGLVRDQRGVRLPKEKVAEAFIDLQFAAAPREGKQATTARAVFG
ncbi:coproporphyrinogen-III oxidase family protein [Crossiella cryophila]|uniref:Heme chaperone HemW n=1 Tax=Crossiella cryophila TaxID=43355 RepID=A0A7W7CIM1_9PSEU|nr:coproporphyrinogen-III oxidase family protein [Crossiella cryophila]MBB4680446.1 oxygen-independent coproporphyrinogen-3 oxidase [Crossiella cryophila]